MARADNPQETKFWLQQKCLTTFITHCKFQPLVFNTFEKMTFQHFFPYKCMGTQIWPCYKKVKGQRTDIIWTNFVDLESSMLYTKIQPKAFLVLEKKLFKCYYHIWAWPSFCLIARNHLNILTIPFWQKAACEIWWKLLKRVDLALKMSKVNLRSSFEQTW